jgi:hypothetical protein
LLQKVVNSQQFVSFLEFKRALLWLLTGVYGNNQHYPQAMSMGQASQQFASQPTGAGVPGNQFQAASTQPPPQLPTQKRERKPLAIVNPETNQAIDIGGSTGGTTAEVPTAVPPPVAAATTAAPPSQRTLEVIHPQPVRGLLCF